MPDTSWFAGNVNTDLGPCDAIWDPSGDDIAMGGFDSLKLKIANEKADTVYAQNGTKAANRFVVGQEASIEAGLAQATLERMGSFVQGFDLNQDTAGVVLGYSFGSVIGQDDLSIAKQIDCTKYADGAVSTDALEKISVWKAAPTNELELAFDASSQRFVQTMFTAYRDTSNVNTSGNATFFGSGTIA